MADLEDVTLDGRPLHSLRVADLKAALEQRGLSKSGQKNALVKRLKGALMLESLQRTSTPHIGLQPNSQIGEEMSQNSFIKQYLAKQQELLKQRLEREAREAVESDDQEDHTAVNNSTSHPAAAQDVAPAADQHTLHGPPDGEGLAGPANEGNGNQEANMSSSPPPALPTHAAGSMGARGAGSDPRPERVPTSSQVPADSDDEDSEEGEEDGDDEDWDSSARRRNLGEPARGPAARERSGASRQPPQHHASLLSPQLRQPTPPPSPPPELSFPLPDTPKQSPPSPDMPPARQRMSSTSSSGSSSSDSRSSSPEPQRSGKPGPLSLLARKMESEGAFSAPMRYALEGERQENSCAAATSFPGRGPPEAVVSAIAHTGNAAAMSFPLMPGTQVPHGQGSVSVLKATAAEGRERGASMEREKALEQERLRALERAREEREQEKLDREEQEKALRRERELALEREERERALQLERERELERQRVLEQEQALQREREKALQKEERERQRVLEEERAREERERQRMLEEERERQRMLEEERERQRMLEEERERQRVLEEERERQRVLEEERERQRMLEQRAREERERQRMLEEERAREERERQRMLEEEERAREERERQRMVEEERARALERKRILELEREKEIERQRALEEEQALQKEREEKEREEQEKALQKAREEKEKALQKEREEKEKALQKEREEKEKALQKEREEKEKALQKEREEQEKALQKERKEKKEREEQEKALQKEREEKEREEEKALQKEREEKERGKQEKALQKEREKEKALQKEREEKEKGLQKEREEQVKAQERVEREKALEQERLEKARVERDEMRSKRKEEALEREQQEQAEEQRRLERERATPLSPQSSCKKFRFLREPPSQSPPSSTPIVIKRPRTFSDSPQPRASPLASPTKVGAQEQEGPQQESSTGGSEGARPEKETCVSTTPVQGPQEPSATRLASEDKTQAGPVGAEWTTNAKKVDEGKIPSSPTGAALRRGAGEKKQEKRARRRSSSSSDSSSSDSGSSSSSRSSGSSSSSPDKSRSVSGGSRAGKPNQDTSPQHRGKGESHVADSKVALCKVRGPVGDTNVDDLNSKKSFVGAPDAKEKKMKREDGKEEEEESNKSRGVKEAAMAEPEKASESIEETPKAFAARRISLSSSKTSPGPINAEGEQEPGAGSGRKRRWGSSTAVTAKKPSISITTESLKSLIPDIKPCTGQEAVVDLHPEEAVLSGAEDEERKRPDGELQIRRTVTQVVPSESQENGQKEPKRSRREESSVEGAVVGEEKMDTSLTGAVETQSPSHSGHDVEMNTVTPGETPVRRSISQPKSGLSITIDDPVRTSRQPSPPRGKVSDIVHVSNLVRPFTLGQLKELLGRTGTLVEEGFWIDKIKSHCYVTYSSTEEAVATREALHGVKWPQSNPKVLSVDFCQQDELDFHKRLGTADRPGAEDQGAGRGRTSALPPLLSERDQWAERASEMERRERARAEREWDRDKVREFGKPGEEREGVPRRSRSRERRRKEKKADKKDKAEEPPAKLLDDLFRKTKAAPCIFWLPLTEEQFVQREAARAERMKEREKRRKELEEEEEKKREEERKERMKATGGDRGEGEKERDRERDRDRGRERDRDNDKRRDGYRRPGGSSAGGGRRSRSRSDPRDRRR